MATAVARQILALGTFAAPDVETHIEEVMLKMRLRALLRVGTLSCGLSCVASQPSEEAPRDSTLENLGNSGLGSALAYSASGRIIETGNGVSTIVLSLTIQNNGKADRIIGVGGCGGVKLRVYPASGPSATARRDQDSWENATNRVCNDWLFEHAIAPTRSFVLKDSVQVKNVLGDSLPATQYFLSAFLCLNGTTLQAPIGIRRLTL
ncbi:MAG: hypothetical protein M3Z54_02045 [Gemmatimonadota bacterium]|nr:hypothetical protein [Gemmatimonadota bacterium]